MQQNSRMLISSSNEKRIKDILLLIPALAFLLYFILMQWHNRPALEENSFICAIRQGGPWNLFRNIYLHSGGRWSGFAVLTIVYYFSSIAEKPWLPVFIYFVCLIGFLVASIRLLLKEFFRKIMTTNVGSRKLLSWSIILTAAIYYSSFSITDDWYWMSSSFIYVLPLPFGIAGLALLLRDERTILQTLAMWICFVFVGSGAENISVSVFFGMIFFLGSVYINRKLTFKNILKDAIMRKTLPVFIIFLFSMASSLLAPGNFNRIHYEQTFRGQNKLEIIPPGKMDFNDKKPETDLVLQRKNIVWLFLSAIGFFIGAKSSSKSVDHKQGKKLFRFLLLMTGISAIVTLAFMELVFHTLGPLRSWLPVTTAVTFLIFYLSFRAGIFFREKIPGLEIISSLYYFLVLVLFVMQISNHLPLVRAHAMAYDERVAMLKGLERSGNKNTIELDPLPISGILLPSEITADEKDVPNKKFAKAIGITFPVKLKR